jgi:hypothetical protein
VQYIVTDGDPVVELQSPAFGRDFRFVSGPHLYQGEAFINNKKVPVQNFSYTLIPLRKGRLVVKGATAVFGSGKVKSNDTYVVVAEPAKEDPLTSTRLSGLPRLAQGVNWKEQLQEQLFIKTDISRQRCFVGEPVVATFTLFSRLPSASEIIKNPGFYGFSVLEIPNAVEGGQTIQTHNGAFYNTHVLRKVQLYPAQAGELLIDKMSVHNAIEYVDSASGAPVKTTVVLESAPATIDVKPLPATPLQHFTGATGRFSIKAHLEKSKWRQNSNGKLNVTLNGSGNFVQLAAPEIQWPKGVDVFEPASSERLQKDVVPVSGTRTYTYTLTADSTGDYTIPPVAFTYFDPTSKSYETVSTDSMHFTVLEGVRRPASVLRFRKQASGWQGYLWAFAAVAVLAMVVFFWFRKFRSRNNPAPAVHVAVDNPVGVEAQIEAIGPHEAQAYRRLQQALMGFLKSWDAPPHTTAQGTVQHAAAGLPVGLQKDLQAILDECEAVQYYNAAPTVPFAELQQQALYFVRSVKRPERPGRG